MSSITFEDLTTKLEAVATLAGAASVIVGGIDDGDRIRDTVFPLVWFIPTTSTPANATVSRSFEVHIYDELNTGDTNQAAKWSSTEVIGLQIIANLKNNFDNREYEFTTGSMQAVTNEFENLLHGWVFTFEVLTPYTYDICD